MTAEFKGVIEVYILNNNVFTGIFAGYSKYGIKLVDAKDKQLGKFYRTLIVTNSRIVNVIQLKKEDLALES